MKRDAILKVIRGLAKSQGFYGRLLQHIEESPEEDRESFFNHLEAQNFKDELELILYLEEG